jgi:hypothetical protein
VSHHSFTRAERIKLFIREYYTANSIYSRTIRIIGGPLVIGSGLHLYQEPTRFAIGYGGFCICYGIYYTLKPFVITALRPSLFKAGEFDVSVSEASIKLADDEATVDVLFSSFERITRHSNDYAIKLPGKMTMYLKIPQLTKQEVIILDNHLTAK